MTGRTWYSVGLFFATFAAFTIGFGVPQTARAANEPASNADRAFSTPEGKAALARAGISEARFKDTLAKLSPEQRKTVEDLLGDKTPKAVLTARMIEAGYTPAEAAERISFLSDGEIAKLAHNPDASTAGTGVGTALFIISLILVAVLVTWYFVVVEEPSTPTPPPPPAK